MNYKQMVLLEDLVRHDSLTEHIDLFFIQENRKEDASFLKTEGGLGEASIASEKLYRDFIFYAALNGLPADLDAIDALEADIETMGLQKLTVIFNQMVTFLEDDAVDAESYLADYEESNIHPSYLRENFKVDPYPEFRRPDLFWEYEG